MADTSPVAHEGNPKEDSITISGGSVLSTATLTVVSPFVPIVPPPAIPPPPDDGGGDGMCDFVVVTRNVGNCPSDSIVDQYSVGSYAPATGSLNGINNLCGSSTQGVLSDSATKLNFTVRSGEVGAEYAGLSLWYTAIPAIPDTHLVRASYELIQGTPISGMAFFVDPASTPCDFTGYVFLVDHPNNRSIFGYYEHANLFGTHLDSGQHVPEMPTILSQVAAIPTNNIEAYVCTDCFPTFDEFEAIDNNVFSLTYPDVSAFTPSVIPMTGVMGFIWVAYTELGLATHEAHWTDHTGFGSVAVIT